MLFTVTHTTTYCYSQPICLDPHTLRLRPRDDGTQRLLHFHMQIEPQPAGVSEGRDQEGNATTYTWFEGKTNSLRVITGFALETLRSNPFDYLLSDPSAQTLPLRYVDDLQLALVPYCTRATSNDLVAQFATDIAYEVGGQLLPFLATLNQRIYDLCLQIVREQGDPQPPEVSLTQRQGSCRDLAVLFIDACRVLGIAARFVSGYHEGEAEQEKRLHAWAEVYIPGGGWRGYDPTADLAVADRHVAVASGLTPRHAAPITGSFRGSGVVSTMQTDIQLHVSGRAGS